MNIFTPAIAWTRTPAIGCACLALFQLGQAQLAPELVYSTDFEPPLYASGVTLDGQDSWVAYPAAAVYSSQTWEGDPWDYGMHGLIGLVPPEQTNVSSCSVYRPLNYSPLSRGRPLVTFRTTLAIVDSVERTERDAFRWSVYNREGARLFSLEFDNLSAMLWMQLDDGTFQSLDRSFQRDAYYDLELHMQFASNRWSAVLNGELIVNAALLTTKSNVLDLGDIDAVWVQSGDQTRFGDNYMAFDDYRVSAREVAPLPCEVHLLQFLDEGSRLLRLVGEPGQAYAVDFTTDFVHWTALETNVPGDGSFLVEDWAPDAAARFYRGRAIWP